MDTETEQRIQEALDRLLVGRTSLVIAHRLSTVQRCDRILVLHKGVLREQGTHQELLALRGIYYRLYLLQYRDQLRGAAEAVAVPLDEAVAAFPTDADAALLGVDAPDGERPAG